MDTTTTEPVVINRADGTSLSFKRCSPADRMRFRAIFRSYRKVELANSLRILGVVGRDALPDLNEIDKRRLREGEVLEWVNQPEGAREAVLLSLRHDRPEAKLEDVDALGLDEDEMLRAAAGVFNLVIVQRPAEGGASPPLLPGPASGPSGTGDATPTDSGGDCGSGPTTP